MCEGDFIWHVCHRGRSSNSLVSEPTDGAPPCRRCYPPEQLLVMRRISAIFFQADLEAVGRHRPLARLRPVTTGVSLNLRDDNGIFDRRIERRVYPVQTVRAVRRAGHSAHLHCEEGPFFGDHPVDLLKLVVSADTTWRVRVKNELLRVRGDTADSNTYLLVAIFGRNSSKDDRTAVGALEADGDIVLVRKYGAHLQRVWPAGRRQRRAEISRVSVASASL